MLAALAEKHPEIEDNVGNVVLLAPFVGGLHFGYISDKLLDANLWFYYRALGFNYMDLLGSAGRKMQSSLCLTLGINCEFFIHLLSGDEKDFADVAILKTLTLHYPSITSIKNLLICA